MKFCPQNNNSLFSTARQHFLEVFGGERVIFDNIEALCKERGTNISQLERNVGLANATIRRWSNSSPTVENLKKVADYFGVTVDELLKA